MSPTGPGYEAAWRRQSARPGSTLGAATLPPRSAWKAYSAAPRSHALGVRGASDSANHANLMPRDNVGGCRAASALDFARSRASVSMTSWRNQQSAPCVERIVSRHVSMFLLLILVLDSVDNVMTE